ncbi:hypothetical protein CBR_g34672 [Chara braunii]|uniref:DUF659 domain-containing protein n=1 Tax=Chara braunii TaxID=69332 RepID=A0A388JYX3_CHABU|nr:hypothetical protein CBR_g34672 [Chara braunii]|eukprot:GBG62972.1 hypothetical protein CBR_g34672 [Chara braunii]
MLPGNARGLRRLRCKLCNKEYSGNRKRAWEHFILARASARCPHSNLSIWRRLHGIGVQLPPDLHERVQRVLEMEKSDEGDTPVLGGGEGVEGGIAEDPGEAPGGDTMEVDIGEDEGTRGVVTGGLATAGRANSSQVVVQGAHTRGPTRQTRIRRFAKNPRQEDMDHSCCEFFVENTIPFNAARSRSFKKFMLTCIGPQPVGCEDVSEGDKDSAVVIAGWKRFFREWGVEKITAICTNSFAGNTSAARMLREDPEFTQIYWIHCTAHCMDLLMHDIGKKEWADEIITKANKIVNFFRIHRWPRSQLRTQLLKYPDLKCTCLLRPAQTRFGTNYVMLQRLEVCERAIVRIITGHGWETMMWQRDIRVKAYFVEETVLDKAFWADVKKLTAVMKGPYDVLREVDKDVHCLSRIYDMACRLPGFVRSAPLSADQRDDLLRNVGNRTDILLSPIHAVARLLDPMLKDITVFSNVDLMAQFESVVERLIGKSGSSRFDDCMDQLYEFQFGRGTKPRNKLHHQCTEKSVASHWSLRLKSMGQDEATVAGGWLGLAADWEDEDMEGDMANVTEAVDDIEAAGEGTASAVGNTNIRPDPTVPSTSRPAQRLVQVEEEDEDEADEDDDDDVPDEEWVDERSDSGRSWTRREGMVPYIEGTRSGFRSQTRARPEAQQGEQQQQQEQVEEQQEQAEQQQEGVEQQQQQRGQGDEEQKQEQQQEQQCGQGDEEQQQQRGDEEHQQHQTDEEQPQQREKEQQQQRVDPAVQQETAVQSSRDVHEEGEAEGEQGRCEVRGFYGSSQRSPLVGQHGAHPGRVWDPLAYRAPRGRGRAVAGRGRGRTHVVAQGTDGVARGSGCPRGRPRKEKPLEAVATTGLPAAEESDDDPHESAPLQRKKRRTEPAAETETHSGSH